MLQKLNEISKGKNMIWNKVIAVMLVITLTFANFILLGVVTGKGVISYAADNLEAQSNSTQHTNVKFDAYFMNEGVKTHAFMLDANETAKLYFALNVRNNGYLKNASIELNSNNYSIAAQLQASEIMEKIEDNKIILKQVNYGTEAIVDLPILLEINNEFQKENVNKQSSLTLRGIYVTKEGKEVEIEKEIKLNLSWIGSANVKLVSDISKYMVNDEQKEIFLQEKVELSKEEKTLPLQKTMLEIEVPKYNEILPEKVSVIANELGLTTGKQNEEIEFYNTNWKYNNQTGKLTIEVENKEVNGNIWAGLGKDEYVVNYVYGEEAYNTKQEQNQIKTNISAKVYNYSGNEIKENTVKNEENKILTEEIGNVVTGKVEVEQNISKGNMYANCNSNNREYETKYNVKEIVEIPYLSQVQNVNIQELTEQFLDEKGNKNSTKIGGLNYTYYEKTEINVDNFKKILGQDGFITIANSTGSEIGRIDVNTKQEEGNYVFSYEEKQDSIILQTSTPIAEGNLIINHKKAIKADLPYTRNQIVGFKQLQSNVSIINNQEEVITSNVSSLKETSTKVDMSINKQTITSENENVEIKLELNNTNEQSDLFVNPKFVIELPKNITSAKIEKVEVLFDDELKVKNYTVTTNENGNKQLEINLTGTQTKYNTVPNTNGTTINIQAKLGASQTAEGKAKLRVENENAVNYENIGTTEVILNGYIEVFLDITDTDTEDIIDNEPIDIVLENEVTNQGEALIKKENLKITLKENENNNIFQEGKEINFEIELENLTPEKEDVTWSEEDTKALEELQRELLKLQLKEELTSDEKETENQLEAKEIELRLKYSQGEEKDYYQLLKNYQTETEKLNNERIQLANSSEKLTIEQEKRLNEIIEKLKSQDFDTISKEDIERLKILTKKNNDSTLGMNFINDVELSVNLANNIKYVNAKLVNPAGDEIEDEYEIMHYKDNNMLKITMKKFPQNLKNKIFLRINAIADNIGEEIIKEQTNQINLKYEQGGTYNEIERSIKIKISKIKLDIIKTIEGLKENITVGDKITFKLQIENKGLIDCNNVYVYFKLPDEMEFTQITYGNEEQAEGLETQEKLEQDEKGFKIPLYQILAQEKIVVNLTALVKNIKEDIKNSKIEADILYSETSEEQSKILSQNVVWEIEINGSKNNNNDDTQTKKYSIEGIAWLDEDLNGIKSESEKIVKDLEVVLLDKKGNTIATTKTSEKGKYKFENILLGEYQIVFNYNDKEYTLTEYKKTEQEEINSNAIKTKEGQAVTESITIIDKNVRNINIGLVKVKKFDMSLQKRISKITVQNKSGTSKYDYNNVNLAKTEIHKNYINESNIIIEYKILVTNEGELAGTVGKVIDYMPKEMIFSSDINNGWYQDNSGNLYYTGLSNEIIGPGKSREITLLLKMKMTEDSTGIINNRAEIYEVSNQGNIADFDSVPGNKETEDDISMADAIIGVKTGNVAIYTIVTTIALIILGTGIIFIKKFVIKK